VFFLLRHQFGSRTQSADAAGGGKRRDCARPAPRAPWRCGPRGIGVGDLDFVAIASADRLDNLAHERVDLFAGQAPLGADQLGRPELRDLLLAVAERLAASNTHLQMLNRILGDYVEDTKAEAAATRSLSRMAEAEARAERRRAARNEVGQWIGLVLVGAGVAVALLGLR
jgi:hypothetical protein